MQVVEKFVSINGEGTRAGELAVFIRFRGCNLDCSYCDTKWANTSNCPAEDLSIEEITAYVDETGVTNVTLTGGEPLLQRDIRDLITSLMEHGHRVEIETNGSVDLSEFCGNPRPVFTMDYKLPDSGCEAMMNTDNFGLLEENDTVKFVSGSPEDLAKAKEIIDRFELLGRCHVYFSPVFGSIEPVTIVDFLVANRMNEARIQIQMHKVIWDPNERGV